MGHVGNESSLSCVRNAEAVVRILEAPARAPPASGDQGGAPSETHIKNMSHANDYDK